MNATERRGRLRELLAGNRCIEPASMFDPVSARIAQDLGFEAGIYGGSTASIQVLGAPDIVLVTLTEFAEQVRRICRGSDLPLLADADHGFGNALSARRTVEELEAAGVAAVTIEDTLFPVPYGGYAETRLISIPEAVGKMRAAMDGRHDPSTVVMGRTIATHVSGIDELVTRAEAYQATGVDGLFFVNLRTRAELDALATKIKLPMFLGGYTPELDDPAYLASRGVKMYFQDHKPFNASIRAIYDTLKAQRERLTLPPGASTDPALNATVTNADRYEKWSNQFLSDTASVAKWR